MIRDPAEGLPLVVRMLRDGLPKSAREALFQTVEREAERDGIPVTLPREEP